MTEGYRLTEMRGRLRGLRQAERLAWKAADSWSGTGFTKKEKLIVDISYAECCRLAVLIQTHGDRLRTKIRKATR